ncbi:lipopolysaccharide biosynthesis protein [Saccharicrinis sp. FJH2]|uniref:lipopolysaccharide biosynthesis protein n=1 Tax=Saccharicrinis sp. FJH65 TaxID=3344659 RepID=UPI0035F464DE
MANKIKQLAKDTVIYGGTTIFTRILNWLLVPLYTYKLENQADYGIVINLYAWTALLLVILTYGMETGFFRFSNKQEGEAKVYSTSILSLGFTSLLFILIIVLFIQPISVFLEYRNYKDILIMLGIIVAMDAFTAIPFARLRYTNRPLRFAFVKIVLVGVNIFFNLFFFIILPAWHKSNPDGLISSLYNPDYGVKYVFVSNLFSSGIVLIMLLPEIIKAKFDFDFSLLKRMLKYSWPILIVGIAGIINQSGDKILYPFLIDGTENARTQLGIYGANYKIAVIMVMFTQGFRYAFEPFIFKHKQESNSTREYADVMKYFIILGIFIFLGVMFYIDIVKYFISSSYHSGLKVVPIVLTANLMFGIFFNLSLWYKLTDKTIFGAWLAILGSVITLGINIIFVPKYGYIASAWANFICYFSMVVISYFLMQKYYPVKYELKKIFMHILIGGLLYVIDIKLIEPLGNIKYALSGVLLLGYLIYILRKEKLFKLFKH